MFRRRAAIVALVFIALVLIGLLRRNSLLQFAFRKAQVRFQNDYHLSLNAASVKFTGIDKVKIEGLTLLPENADTLARVNEVYLNLSIIDLLKLRIGFDEIRVNGALVTVFNEPGRNNLQLRKATSRQETPAVSTGTNYFLKANAMKRRLLRAFNTAFELSDIELQYRDSLSVENILIPGLKYDLDSLNGLLINKAIADTLQISGKTIVWEKEYQLTMRHSGDSLKYLPFLNWERKPKCRFKSVDVNVKFEQDGETLYTTWQCSAEKFHMNHWRLANDDVVFEQASFNGKLKIGEKVIELDSSSVIKLQNLNANVFASYSIGDKDTAFTFMLRMPETVSDTFFHALPGGMFNTLKGISCTGSLQYDLLFSINTSQPDSLVFNSCINRKNFSIIHYGAENYSRINEPFTYKAYDKDRFVRNVEISSANSSFTPLNNINENLIHSVLQSEDPSFMLHRGFLPESFRESVIKNYKERRFARGGSTISMQLVKNVFLSRDKTVSRKVEEALIVYLTENLHLVPKERMLEIYLNAIEWGPNVYGIGEASRIYFNKRPSELNLQESVFLAGIIPAPKYFKYQFDKEGKLKPYPSGYFRILTGRMASKGWINPADTVGLQPV